MRRSTNPHAGAPMQTTRKRLITLALSVLWMATCSVAFAALWVRTPALWVFSPPEALWVMLGAAMGTACCEGGADIAFAIGMILGAFLAILLLLAFFMARRLCKRH